MASMRQDFLDFFDAEYALVVRFMMRMGANLADAEDATQHVAEQGWRKVTRGQWDQIASPQAWARTVALNHYRARCRKRIEISLDLDFEEPQLGPGHAELVGQARDLVVLLQCLDTDCCVVIAFDLDISPRTVEIYRAHVMTKMQARSLSELVRFVLISKAG